MENKKLTTLLVVSGILLFGGGTAFLSWKLSRPGTTVIPLPSEAAIGSGENCTLIFTVYVPPVCESLVANPASLPSSGGTIDLTTTIDPGNGGDLTYVWGSDGGVLSGQDDITPETAAWSIPENTTLQTVTYNAWVGVSNELGSSGCSSASDCTPDGGGCQVSVTVAPRDTNPPVCESLTANPTSLPYFGGVVDLSTTASPGDGGPLSYTWDSDGGTLSGYDDATPETAIWTIPSNETQLPVTYNAWVRVSNDAGSDGGQGTDCSVSVAVAALPENDLSCDNLIVSPSSPGAGDIVSFTCIGTSQLIDASGSPYPIVRIDFRVYQDANEDGIFHEDEIIREGSVAPAGSGPSWTGTYNPAPSVVVGAGYYGASSRVCINYEETEQCTPFATPED